MGRVDDMKTGSVWATLLALILAPLSGVALAYALPPRDINLLGWIAFIPLLLAARLTRPIIAMGCALFCVLACVGVLVHNVSSAAQFANLVAAFGSLGIVLAIVSGLASMASKRLGSRALPIFIACAGVTAEFIGTRLFPVSVAITQHANPAALNLASCTGIWGVTFLIWLVSASIIEMFCNPKQAWPVVLVAPVILAICFVVPHPALWSRSKTIKVAAVQAPDPYNASDITEKLGGRAELVVWPEHVMESNCREANDVADNDNIYLVASYQVKEKAEKPYNLAHILSPQGKIMGTSKKQHLFGKEVFIYSSGKASRPVKCGALSIGTAICFDTEYTDVTRRLARQGADIICVPNHDPEMPNFLFSYLHSAVIPFRAAENGVPIIWAESYGRSMVVDGSGRVIAQAPAGKMMSVVTNLHTSRCFTFYKFAGDYFVYVSIAALLILLMVCFKRPAKIESPSDDSFVMKP